MMPRRRTAREFLPTWTPARSATIGMYFMYDVKQFNPTEWSSPPLGAAIVDKAPFGKVMIGRGAINQKGPEATFLAALHALKAAGRKLAVTHRAGRGRRGGNCFSHFGQVVHQPEVLGAAVEVPRGFMRSRRSRPKAGWIIALGAKGVIECRTGVLDRQVRSRCKDDNHSSYKADLDSAVWRMVKALSTLVSEDANDPAIDAGSNM